MHVKAKGDHAPQPVPVFFEQVPERLRVTPHGIQKQRLSAGIGRRIREHHRSGPYKNILHVEGKGNCYRLKKSELMPPASAKRSSAVMVR
jgi:hypothetical protein